MNFGTEVVGSASNVAVLVGRMVGGGVREVVCWGISISSLGVLDAEVGVVVSGFGIGDVDVSLTATDVFAIDELKIVVLCIEVSDEDNGSERERDEVVEVTVFSKTVTANASVDKLTIFCTLEEVDAVANFLTLIVLNVVLAAAAGASVKIEYPVVGPEK